MNTQKLNVSHSFRSPKTGLYHNLQQYNLERPEDIFSLYFFDHSPEPFFKLSKELIPDKTKYAPSITHYFIKLLNQKGLLVRHYTQNIDGLEVECGLPSKKCVEAHGHFRTATCRRCGASYSSNMYVPLIRNDEIPKCTEEKCDGVIKPDVTFFGESLPDRFWKTQYKDFNKCDLLIIMGTSLQVQPFGGLIHKVKDWCPRMLINMEAVATSELNDPNRDYFLKGTCDDGVRRLAKELGWDKELEKLREDDLKESNVVAKSSL